MLKLFETKLAYYIAWMGFLAFGFLAWYFLNKSKQEERKVLIQSGMNAEDLFKQVDKRRQQGLFKIGIVVIGVGLTFVLIYILDSLHLLRDALYPATFCLGLGMSLVIAYKLGKKGHED